jgi:hypothetical protein
MSMLAARCDRVRDEITIDMLFDALGWEIPTRGRVRCIWPAHEDRSPAMQVYRETNSVYCFACHGSGGVIEIVRKCVPDDGNEWTIDEALDWIESTFHLKTMTPAANLQQRLRKKLQSRQTAPTSFTQPLTGRGTKAQRDVRASMDTLIRQAFAEVERGASTVQLTAAYDLKQYIWEESSAPGVELDAWAAWARRLIYGSYARLVTTFELPPCPPDIVDDRPETCRLAHLWETHRGSEFPSTWHLQLF